jgi:hypothetical protein
MKTQRALFLSVCFVLFGIITVNGQFLLHGEYRPRTEYSHGYKALASKGQQPSLFTSQRTRLIFNYTSQKVKTGLVLQDVRLFGSQPQLVGNHDFGVSIHQAWAELMFHPTFSLKVGRQELVYDNARILGNVDWVQQARSHDVALFKFEGALRAHLGLAYHESGDITNNHYFGPDAYKAMQFLWLHREFGDLKMSFLLLNNGRPVNTLDTLGMIVNQEIEYSQTAGTHLVFGLKPFEFTGYLYAQAGRDGLGREICCSWNGSLQAQYTISHHYQFILGIEHLSGLSQIGSPADGNTAFNPMYGTHHAFNGWMDYFYVGNHLNSIGLTNPYLKFAYKRSKYLFEAHGHYFLAAADIAKPDDPTLPMGKGLGTELDMMIGYNLSDIASIRVGYSQMFGTESLVAIRGGKTDVTSNWAWCQILVRPVFFTSKQ